MWDAGEQVLEGRFRVISLLEQRGPIEVYVAEQSSLTRRVVLRVLRSPVDRFEEEVRRLATVDHPSVMRVIDSGKVGPVQFLVSEFAEGSRLSDELKGEPLLPERALEFLTQIAEGLAAIHDKGLAHGDLRPSTVVVVKGAGGEQVRLSDFGLGWLAEPASAEGATVTMQVQGPADHLAPERLQGARAEVAGDLYSLGVLAYQVLAGVLPDRGALRPLSEAAPHLADATELSALVMRCLETDPTRRPASAVETAKKLAKLPRPAEPTIFLETMQRPPPVPVVKSAPPEAPPPLPKGEVPAAPPLAPARPLLASVMTMTMPVQPVPETPGSAPVAAAPSSRRWLPLGVGAAALVALMGLILAVTGSSPSRDARKLLERRQPSYALEIIGKAQRKLSAPDPELTALKVAGLHLSESHAEEASLFKSLGGAREAMDPLVLSGLLEDFSKKEDPGLRSLLRSLPKKPLLEVLEEFARGPLSARQWGALRYLDLEDSPGKLSLVAEYAASLEAADCGARKVAARRLGQLLDDAAEPALGRLRDAPREGAERNCGQDEAQAALQAIRKGR